MSEDSERPSDLQIEPSDLETEHKLERRPCTIEEDYCAEPGCEFLGKRAQSGVCFNRTREERTWDQIAQLGMDTAEELKVLRAGEFADRPEEYTRWLEAMYETAMENWMSQLDECVCLRVQNRRLRERLGEAG